MKFSVKPLTSFKALAGLGAAALALSSLLASAPAHAAKEAPKSPTGCSYGSGGALAGTLCWLDLTGYNAATASSASGQAFSISLNGGYTATFTVHEYGTPSAVAAAVAMPTWPGAYLGSTAYTGVAGNPALYSPTVASSTTKKVAIEDLVVKDAAGKPVTGFEFAVADAESTAARESITFTSDVALNAIEAPSGNNNYCTNSLTGLGTTSVVCVSNDGKNALVVKGSSPSTIAATFKLDNSRQAAAFAFASTSGIRGTSEVTPAGTPVTADVITGNNGWNGAALDPSTVAIVVGGVPQTTPYTTAEGTFTPTASGIIFTPAPGFTGTTPALTYQVTDVDGNVSEAELVVEVVPVVGTPMIDPVVGLSLAAGAGVIAGGVLRRRAARVTA